MSAGNGVFPAAELERLEVVRARTLALVEGLSQEELDRRPAGGVWSVGAWSVGEVLDHLLRAEAGNRGEIAGLIERARAGRETVVRRGVAEFDIAPAFVPPALVPLLAWPAGVATLLMPAFLREALVRSRLFPARAARSLLPTAGRPGAELRAELAASAAETRALLEADPGLDWHRMVLQHPFLGANDVPQILRLTAAHEERHQDQIRQIRAIFARDR